MERLTIDIFGYADEKICAGCPIETGTPKSASGEGHHESTGESACSHCAPGAKVATSTLVDDFRKLLGESEYRDVATVAFTEADDRIKESHPDIYRLLSAAQLSPVTAVNGKVLFLGGFSPKGLLEELAKRHPL